MERLLCCLLGFPEKDAQVLRSLTRLFRPSLSADWAFEVGVSEDCDLLVCDLDDPGGRHAWNSPAPPGLLRAAASATMVDNAGALVLRKPLRGHGPSGIVQVLNAAAAIKHPEIAPPPPPAPGTEPATATAAPEGPPPAPSAFFKPESAAPRPAAPPPPVPAAGPAPGEAPHLSEWVRVDAEADATAPDATPSAADERRVDAEPAEFPRAAAGSDEADAAAPPPGQASAPLPAPVPVPEPEPEPAWASEAPHHHAEPAQDDADIKDILRRMRFATVGTPSEAPTMLAALRELRGSDKAAVLEAPGLTPLCVMPQARAWFSTGTAAEVFGWLGEGNRPVRVLPFGSTEEARDAAGAKDEPPRPLEQLMWLACLRTPPERLAPYEIGAVPPEALARPRQPAARAAPHALVRHPHPPEGAAPGAGEHRRGVGARRPRPFSRPAPSSASWSAARPPRRRSRRSSCPSSPRRAASGSRCSRTSSAG